MAEHDAFELRLGRALNRYVEGLTVEIDAVGLTESIAAAHVRRWRIGAWRLRAPGLPWTPRALQVAWLVIAAGLLAIMAIGLALAAGSQRPALGFVCPAGSNPDALGPVDQARPLKPYAMAFDRRAGRLVAVTGAGNGVETWTFDVCTNTWTQMHPNREPPDSEWARLVYDVNSDATVLVFSASVWAYDLEADTWTEKGLAPIDATICAYDPVSGLVVAFDRAGEPWNYDVETNTWTPIHQANGRGDGPFAYDTSVDRIVAFGGERRLFDIRTGTWSTSATETPKVIAGYGMSPPEIAYDEAAERTVIIGNWRLAAYDASADRWEIVTDLAGDSGMLPLPMAYDSVNSRLVGWGREWIVGQGGMVAVDLLTREWTVLLEASDVPPAATP